MTCAKMIVETSIKEVVSYDDNDYLDDKAEKFLYQAGVIVKKVKRARLFISFRD
ncbi:MAG: hypothetical protein ACK4NF_01215 [Planctomycetota bacterium]